MIMTGITSGGTNQLFIVCLPLWCFFVIRDQRLVSGALASSLGQSTWPQRFAPGPDVRRCARIQFELGGDGCRASASLPTGTSRTRSPGCPIGLAPGHMLLRVWLEHEAGPAQPQPIATLPPAADQLRPRGRYRPGHCRTGCRDCIARKHRRLRQLEAAVSPTRRPSPLDVPPRRMIVSKAASFRIR